MYYQTTQILKLQYYEFIPSLVITYICTCGKSENKMSVFICLEFIDSFDHIFGRPFTNQIFSFQDDQTHIESLLSRSRM